MSYTMINPVNFGWLEYKLNEKEYQYVESCIENKGPDVKYQLAGNISGSYKLYDEKSWFWHNTVYPAVKEYSEKFKNIADVVPVSHHHTYFMNDWWVNYQYQTEFNPLHCHYGIYSFAIWMKIPTTHFEQNKSPLSLTSNSHNISIFEFVYPNTLGQLNTYAYEMNPDKEGMMLLFPSSMRHQVYPFYNCDKERISVAGNVCLYTGNCAP